MNVSVYYYHSPAVLCQAFLDWWCTTFARLGLVTLSFCENCTILNACPFKWATGLLWINSHSLFLVFFWSFSNPFFLLLLVKQNFRGQDFFFQGPTCQKHNVRLTWTVVMLVESPPSFKCLQWVRHASLRCFINLKMIFFLLPGSNLELCAYCINAVP